METRTLLYDGFDLMLTGVMSGVMPMGMVRR